MGAGVGQEITPEKLEDKDGRDQKPGPVGGSIEPADNRLWQKDRNLTPAKPEEVDRYLKEKGGGKLESVQMNDASKVLDLSKLPQFPNATPDMLNRFLGAACLKAGEEKLTDRNGKPLVFFDNFDLQTKVGDGRDAERQHWVKGTAKVAESKSLDKDNIPDGVKIESSAAQNGSQIVLRAKLSVERDWKDEEQSRSHSMSVKDASGKVILDENGQEKSFPSVHKKGVVHEGLLKDNKPVLEIVNDKESKLRVFVIPHPGKEIPGFVQEQYVQSVVSAALGSSHTTRSDFVEFPMYEKTKEGHITGVEGTVWKGGAYIAEYKFKDVDGANEKGLLSTREEKIVMTRGGMRRAPELPPATKVDQRMFVAYVAKDGTVMKAVDINTEHMKRPDLKKLKEESEKGIN